MRILLVTQHFSPEITSCALRMDAFTEAWREEGHDVTVLTAVPNHPEGVIHQGYRGRPVVRERRGSADVVRTWVRTSPGKGAVARLMTYGSFAAMATTVGALRVPRPDIVVATTPPPMAGVAGAALATRYRVPFVLDVRDLWPDAAIAMGELAPGRAASALQALVQWLYRRADLVVAATEGFAEEIGHGAEVIPNGCDPRVAALPDDAGEAIRHRLGLEDRFVVGFVGNHGVCEGLEEVVDAAGLLGADSGVHLLMVGDGPRRDELIARANATQARNVTFHPPVSVDEVGSFIRASDVLIVPLRNDPHFSTRFPAKLFDAWACGRPVLVGWDGDARRLAEGIAAGSFAPSGRPEALAAEMIRLRDLGPDVLRERGRNGRAWVLAERNRSAAARRLADRLAQVAGFVVDETPAADDVPAVPVR
ncbi:MAG TPA: glycosyltransferase family 4 protein [Miltoncostaeaceae bacterium]|nr:glycosyltransferase family 4 protein [Miltoncostaeaceae bacterium]